MVVRNSRSKRTGAAAPSADGKARKDRTAQPACVADIETDAQLAMDALDIARQARRHTQAALRAFVAVMQDESAPAAARVAAATQILNWGHGKAAGGEGESATRTVKLAWEA